MCPHVELRAAGLVIFRRVTQCFEYLLLQTSYGEHHWTPPKGHVDPGESDYETALRETKEEAGLSVEDLNIYAEFRRELKYDVNNKKKTVTYWLAELKNSTVQIKLSDEHKDFKWLPLAEAQILGKYTEMAQLLKDCEDFLQSRN
ncbi:Bis(5'-nucleosyl)-tetraphosphatase [asymmetrical] [Armadillidium nasatum]|uniref:Bis(5'-nucleosyl)-tetraphosphatase [asymmetrical] n=1 Tax=Armadillidium nasatum TaxID=96803 RepID=A0A5N5SMI3_9CRUS|nr:Bis(5'-nucleosyl)-tetraphosphatase [asymmetrical] [Armadillidium nasatum]